MTYMRHRSALLLGTILASMAMAHPAMAGQIQGNVLDGTATRSLQAAQVELVELNRSAETERDGSFQFSDVPAGTYTLVTRYVGAPTVTRTIEVPQTGTVDALIRMGSTDDTILVVGLAANQASSLSRKRAADGVSSVLTRDAIGQFPDQNVAESLRRLPGINVLNDQGEGRFVSVRGLDPNLNSSSINGVRVPSPESGIRAVALDVISSDLIESIEVKKSLTPDMDADTIGASIEINTVSAFDRKRDLYSFRVEGSYNDLRDTLTPKASFDFSKKLGDDFGIAGGASYYQRKFATNNVEADGWTTGDDGTDFVEEVEYRDYDVERKRFSATLNFDYRLSDTTELYARGLYSQFDDQEYRRRLIFDVGDFDQPVSVNGDSVVFVSNEDEEIGVERDLKDRMESQKIRSLVIGGKTLIDQLSLKYSASWSKSTETENDNFDPATFKRDFAEEGLGVAFDYSNDRIPRYDVSTPDRGFFDAATYELDEIEFVDISDASDEEFAGRFDIGYVIPAGLGEFTVQGGTKLRFRTKRYNLETSYFEDATGQLTLADVLGKQSYGFALIDPVPSNHGVSDYSSGNRDDFELQEIDSLFDSNVEDYRNEEDIYAGYLLGRYDSSMLRVIGGIRVEHTENDISANTTELIEEGATFMDAVLEDDLVVVTPNRFKRSYTDWLPSVNVRYEPVRNLVLRAAGYRSLVRPNLADLAPRFAVEETDDDGREGDFGNPDLLPYQAWNFDASAEYYFTSNGAITANVFYKDIDNFIVDLTDRDTGVFNNIAYDTATIPINGESAKVFGAEFSLAQAFTFLPSPLDGFLTQLNYTYTDAEGTVMDEDNVERIIPLPTSSKHTFNVVLGYEKGPVSLRLAGTYRDTYLDELGNEANEDRYVDDLFQLDATAKYDVNDKFQMFVEASNLTDAPYFAYQNYNDRKRLLQYEEYSFTIKFGVRVVLP